MRIQTERALVWWAILLGLMLFWSAALTLTWCSLAEAQQKMWDVTLAWNPNTEADLAEYRLYENGLEVSVVPAGTETVDRVLGPGTYSWYLTAVDTSMNESLPSQSVGITLDEVPPDVSGVSISINISVHVSQ